MDKKNVIYNLYIHDISKSWLGMSEKNNNLKRSEN